MKKFYVYQLDGNKGSSEMQLGKYDDLDEARAIANDAEYCRRRDKQPGSVEIRQYVNDIEDEDCECFDYDTFSFAEQTITTIENHRDEIYDAMEELEKRAINSNGLYYSLYMSEDGSLYTGEETSADTEPEAVWSGKDICLRQAHYDKWELDDMIMNTAELNYGNTITALKENLADGQTIPDDIIDEAEYIDSHYPDVRERVEEECKEGILDNIDFNDLIDWKVKEIRDSE